MLTKECLGYLSLVIALVGQVLYLWSIARKHSKPHAFSWLIWSVLNIIAFFAQYSKGAGPGAWATAFTAFACFSVTAWALFQGEKDITRSDRITFIGALMTVPVWYFTQNPLCAVMLIILIDALGYWPTFRKSYFRPREEMISTYVLGTVKFIFSLLAMENYSLVTALYPAFMIAGNTVFIAMVVWRRSVITAADT